MRTRLGVGVVIPTCRRPERLARALASVRDQTRAPEAVVVVDDAGAVAETRRVVTRCGPANARAMANDRSPGASGARNAGAARLATPLLAFLDDDDAWLPDHLERSVARLDREEADLVCVGLVYEDGAGSRPGKLPPGRLDPRAFLVRNPGLVGSNFVIRRERFREVGGFDESLATHNDLELGLRLALRPGLRYAPLPERLVRHALDARPRLSERSPAKAAGVRRFFELHGRRMTARERAAYRAQSQRLWGVDERGRPSSA